MVDTDNTTEWVKHLDFILSAITMDTAKYGCNCMHMANTPTKAHGTVMLTVTGT